MKLKSVSFTNLTITLLASSVLAHANLQKEGRVGSVDYIEGKAFVDGKATSGAREQLPILEDGQSLSTAAGHAEMLLTPGVFLRLDANSKVRLDNTSLTDTRLRLEWGAAMLEVDNLHQDNLIRVDIGTGTVRILKNGLYRFGASPAVVDVLSGQVESNGQDTHLKAGKHRQIAFAPVPAVSKFKLLPDDDLSRWSRLRSEYEAEAGIASAQYAFDIGGPYAYTDWMWNPWFDTWTWFPASGMYFNPYGYGFFSPWMVYYYFPGRYYGPRRYGFAPRAGRVSALSTARSGLTAVPRSHPQPGYGAMRSPAGRMGMGAGRAMPRMSAGRMSGGWR